MEELKRVGKDDIDVVGRINTKGMADVEEISVALRELVVNGVEPEKVVLGGPGNGLVKHGEPDNRGFRPERQVHVRKMRDSCRQEWETRYHMTEPRKILMFERRELVDKVGLVVGEVQVVFPTAEIIYISMFPRFVEVCCKEHMTVDDVVVVESIRREVDRDVEELLQEMDGTIRTVQWWELAGLGGDMTHDMIRMRGVVDKDGVHLSDNTNRIEAVSLCTRLTGREVTTSGWSGGTMKRARW
jgi:hypothetical protein